MFFLCCYLFKPNEKKYHNWIGYKTKHAQQTEINAANYEDLEYFLAPTKSPRSHNQCLSVCSAQVCLCLLSIAPNLPFRSESSQSVSGQLVIKILRLVFKNLHFSSQEWVLKIHLPRVVSRDKIWIFHFLHLPRECVQRSY